MDDVERIAADIADDHPGAYVSITLGDLTLGDFRRLVECVARRDPTITLSWAPVPRQRPGWPGV